MIDALPWWGIEKASLFNYVGLRWVRRHFFQFLLTVTTSIWLYLDDALYYGVSVCLLKPFIEVLLLFSLPSSIHGKIKWSKYRLPKYCWGCSATNVPKVTTNAHTTSHMMLSIVSIITFWLSNRSPNHRTQFQKIEVYLHRAIRTRWFNEILKKYILETLSATCRNGVYKVLLLLLEAFTLHSSGTSAGNSMRWFYYDAMNVDGIVKLRSNSPKKQNIKYLRKGTLTFKISLLLNYHSLHTFRMNYKI